MIKHSAHTIVLMLASVSLVTSQSTASKPSNASKHSESVVVKPQALDLPEAKVVQYGDKDVIRLKTKIRYTTLIVLPKNEQILDFTCGDKEYWVVNGSANLAYVKPAKPGAQTNLNLITASGNIYSFTLLEVSETPEGTPDLKVFVEPKDQSMISNVSTPPKFVSTQVVDDYRQQVALAKDETRQVRESAQNEIDRGITRFIGNMRFPYRFEAGRKPFYVRAIYNDDKFTYIQARPEETPALYEIKDGKPNLVDFTYQNGVYVVAKILDAGYLAIGKQKLSFKREP